MNPDKEPPYNSNEIIRQERNQYFPKPALYEAIYSIL